MTLSLRYAAKSDVGMVRTSNEDSGFAGQTLLAVADGMGGHAAGELASSTAIATLAELDDEALGTGDILTALDDSVMTAAERIADYVRANPDQAGMGTTVTAIAWRDGRIGVIHVGDSRAYLLREAELSQLTKDHTYVQSLVDAGRITQEEARVHPRRSLLMRAIDGKDAPERDLSIRQAQAGDRYLLCSDGLSGVVDDAEIAQILTDFPDLTAAVTALVDRAIDAGAPDNVTVVLADVVSTDTDSETPPSKPVVVGAAGEQRNRAQLPGLHFPDDVGVDSETTDPDGIPALGPPGQPMGTQATAAPPEPDAPTIQPGTAAAGVVTAEPETDSAHPPAAISPSAESPVVEAGVPEQRGALRRFGPVIAVVGLVLAGLALGLIGFAWWLGSQWFLGASTSGFVIIGQGVPQSFLGLQFYRTAETSGLQVSALPAVNQRQIARTIEATTWEDARSKLDTLAAQAKKNCAKDPLPEGCPVPQPTATPQPSTQGQAQ